jgi:hypothetical protein
MQNYSKQDDSLTRVLTHSTHRACEIRYSTRELHAKEIHKHAFYFFLLLARQKKGSMKKKKKLDIHSVAYQHVNDVFKTGEQFIYR